MNSSAVSLMRWATSGVLGERVSVAEKIEEVNDVCALLADGIEKKLLPTDPFSTLENAEVYFRERVAGLCYDHDSDDNPDHPTDYAFEFYDIPALSIALYCLHPRFFFPYYFYPRFYALKQVFDEFGIFLPPVPPKKAIDDRFYYYFELCRSVHHFAAQHGIPGELAPVFLYGFAPLALELDDALPANLPPPRRAWFVGGGVNQNGDFRVSRPGNRVVSDDLAGQSRYPAGRHRCDVLPFPRSYVHSFWRALRFGAVEPFRYFYNTIWIGRPTIVTPILLNEMRQDPAPIIYAARQRQHAGYQRPGDHEAVL